MLGILILDPRKKKGETNVTVEIVTIRSTSLANNVITPPKWDVITDKRSQKLQPNSLKRAQNPFALKFDSTKETMAAR